MTQPTGVGQADITNLARAFATSGTSMKASATHLVHEAVGATEEYAKAYAPVRSGRLRGSISSYSDDLTGVVQASASYAIFVELGTGTRGEFPTGPITIKPKTGQYLSWIDGNGKRVFAKSVTSPGMAPKPFLRPALQRAIEELEGQLGVAAVLSIVKGPNT